MLVILEDLQNFIVLKFFFILWAGFFLEHPVYAYFEAEIFTIIS